MRKRRILFLALAFTTWLAFVVATWAHHRPFMAISFFLFAGLCAAGLLCMRKA